jgi:hypothetical protein
MATEIPTSRATAERQEDKKTTRALGDASGAGEVGSLRGVRASRDLRTFYR